MSKKLSVCFSIATISRNGAGVAESARLQSLCLEKDRSAEISVVTLTDDHFNDDSPYWSNVPLISHRAWGPSILGFSPLVLFSLLRKKPDIVHVHGIWQFHCLSVWLWSILTGGTYVVSPHGMLEPWIRARSPLLKKLISRLYHDRFLRASDAIHLLTANERKDVSEFLVDQPVKIIPNYVIAVEDDGHRPPWWQPGFDNRRIFLFFGRIHEKKGCLELCDAWEALCASDEAFRASCRLVFCGWNDGLAGFEQRIAALQSRYGNIHFAGPQYGPDKNRSLSNASFLVLPSKSEGLPMTVLEAWSAGLPVIMTEECNLSEGFAAGAALKTRTDALSLMQSLKQAAELGPAELKPMAASGRALVAEKYSSAGAGRALLDLYAVAQQHRLAKGIAPTGGKRTVSVIYHFFPHYRAPIMRKLAASNKYNYEFYGSLHNTSGIKVFPGDENIKINPIEFELKGSRWVLRGFMKAVLKKDVEVIIVHGHPNMPASWIMSIVARLTGRKIIYWAHGWLYKEVFWKRIVRNLHFSLANAVMTYGERAVAVARETGYWRDNIFPIGNSLDWDKRCDLIDEIASRTQYRGEMTRKYFGAVERPLIICSARITPECRQDILLSAAKLLKDRGKSINILLIGDGPERQTIEAMARDLDVPVHCFGACYEEETVGLMTYYADITVSPGKVGLTAMQSMMYGTPVITHDHFDKQMPEFEAVKPGVTGDFFEYSNPADLADRIEGWLARATDRESVRQECFAEIERRWTPDKQMQMIENVIDTVIDQGSSRKMLSGSRNDSEQPL